RDRCPVAPCGVNFVGAGLPVSERVIVGVRQLRWHLGFEVGDGFAEVFVAVCHSVSLFLFLVSVLPLFVGHDFPGLARQLRGLFGGGVLLAIVFFVVAVRVIALVV